MNTIPPIKKPTSLLLQIFKSIALYFICIVIAIILVFLLRLFTGRSISLFFQPEIVAIILTLITIFLFVEIINTTLSYYKGEGVTLKNLPSYIWYILSVCLFFFAYYSFTGYFFYNLFPNTFDHPDLFAIIPVVLGISSWKTARSPKTVILEEQTSLPTSSFDATLPLSVSRLYSHNLDHKWKAFLYSINGLGRKFDFKHSNIVLSDTSRNILFYLVSDDSSISHNHIFEMYIFGHSIPITAQLRSEEVKGTLGQYYYITGASVPPNAINPTRSKDDITTFMKSAIEQFHHCNNEYLMEKGVTTLPIIPIDDSLPYNPIIIVKPSNGRKK